MAKDIIVQQIIDLSQKEGLNDSEIGEQLGYARGSIQRIRKLNNIPTAKKENRKDKHCICYKCNKVFFIRRCEADKIYYCPECEKEEKEKYEKLKIEKAFTNKSCLY